MKKLLLALSAVVVIAGVCYADARILPNGTSNYSGTIRNTGNQVKASAGLVYTMTLVATSTNAEMDVYDLNAAQSSGLPTFEVAVATSGDTKTIDLSGAPANFDHGILVDISKGYGYITYK